MLSFDDQELAALRTAAAALPPGQRDRFLKTVASALECCVAIGPGTVAQIATAIQWRLLADGGDGDNQPTTTKSRRQHRSPGATLAPASRAL